MNERETERCLLYVPTMAVTEWVVVHVIEVNEWKKKHNNFCFSAGVEKIVNNKINPLPLPYSSLVCKHDNADKRKKIGHGEGVGKCFIGPSQKPMSCPWSVLL